MESPSINNPQRLPIPSLAPEVWYTALQHDISPRFIPTQEDSRVCMEALRYERTPEAVIYFSENCSGPPLRSTCPSPRIWRTVPGPCPTNSLARKSCSMLAKQSLVPVNGTEHCTNALCRPDRCSTVASSAWWYSGRPCVTMLLHGQKPGIGIGPLSRSVHVSFFLALDG